jgi:hypothetical protein
MTENSTLETLRARKHCQFMISHRTIVENIQLLYALALARQAGLKALD